MNLIDIFSLAFGALKDRKLRTALTMLGVMVGPATIVTLLAITQGFSVGITEQFEKTGVNTVMVFPSESKARLTANDIQTIQRIEHVELVLPFYQLPVTFTSGGSASTATITAIDVSEFPDLLPGFSMLDGQLPQDYELTSAVIGYNLAYPTDPDVTSISMGQVISVSLSAEQFGQQKTVTRSFLVKGVVDKFGAGIFLNIDDGTFITFRAGQTITHSADVHGFYVKVSGTHAVDEVAEAIEEVLEDVRALSVMQIVSIVQSIIGGVNILLGSVGFTSVVAAFFGIMTTMFTTVTERTREIGLLKAIGYSNRLVMMIFLSEATLTGLVGGILGSITGVALSFGIIPILSGAAFRPDPEAQSLSNNQMAGGSFDFNITPFISADLIVMAILMAVGVATLAGLIPALRASRLTPVEALRHE